MFMENQLTTELPLADSMFLQIQRAHKTLTQKPGPEAYPRSLKTLCSLTLKKPY